MAGHKKNLGSKRSAVSVLLDDDQLEELERIRHKTLVPVAVMLRKGADMVIAYMNEREEIIEEGLKKELDEE